MDVGICYFSRLATKILQILQDRRQREFCQPEKTIDIQETVRNNKWARASITCQLTELEMFSTTTRYCVLTGGPKRLLLIK